MRQITLIADSGGTKTDWILVENEKQIKFKGISCHPHYWNTNFWKELFDFLIKKVDPKNCRLFFFGSGCLNPANKIKAAEEFKSMGFDIHVFSDLHAVGYALLGSSNGWCAIAGTGSVLFEWSGNNIERIIGGKGHEIGDEGSGFYFGKLVWERFLEGKLSSKQVDVLNNLGLVTWLKKADPALHKKKFSELSELLFEHKSLFRSIHLNNIQKFISTHLTELEVRELSMSGSYVYYHQDFWKDELNKLSIDLTMVIERPIDRLVERKRHFID